MALPKVFISYLRSTGLVARALFTELQQHFDADEMFYDRDEGDVPVGHDFWSPIVRALESCQVVLAIIDPGWESGLAALVQTHWCSREAAALNGEVRPNNCPLCARS